MKAYIQKDECSWISIRTCEDVLNLNQEYDFVIKKIDKSSSIIYLTLKTEENNPWSIVDLPKVGDIIEIVINSHNPIHFKCIYEEKLEVFMLNDEISWFFLTPNQVNEYIGKRLNVKVLTVDNENERIFCSLRQTIEDPWPIIHESLTVGLDFNAKVIDVTPNYLQLSLPNNYLGILPKESLEKAGHEYKNFQENVVIGQGIDVFVSKVFIAKQRIRLDLKRNKK
jgi:ribosomal protein S1